MRIRLLHADPGARSRLAGQLTAAGHELESFDSGLALERALEGAGFAVLVMRWDGADLSGVALMHRLRAEAPRQRAGAIPGIILLVDAETPGAIAEAADAQLDEAQAEQRITDVVAEVAARRNQQLEAMPRLGALMFDDAAGQVLVHGVPVQLTAKEYALAQYMLANTGKPLARGEIMAAVWGRQEGAGSRTLDAHMAQIRKRLLLQPDHGWRLSSVYGFGYRLDRIDPTAAAS